MSIIIENGNSRKSVFPAGNVGKSLGNGKYGNFLGIITSRKNENLGNMLHFSCWKMGIPRIKNYGQPPSVSLTVRSIEVFSKTILYYSIEIFMGYEYIYNLLRKQFDNIFKVATSLLS